MYGFGPDEDLLVQLLALNLSVAELGQESGAVRARTARAGQHYPDVLEHRAHAPAHLISAQSYLSAQGHGDVDTAGGICELAGMDRLVLAGLHS